MGDAAFLLFSKEPSTGLLVFIIAGTTGMISGYIVDFVHNENFLKINKNFKVEFEKIGKTFVSKFNILWLVIFIPGFIIGLLVAFQ